MEDVTMEQQLLRQMVLDRDRKIMELASGIDDKVLSISKLKIQLTRVRHHAKAQSQVFDEELAVISKQHAAMQHRMARLQRELKHVGSLRIYREALLLGGPRNLQEEEQQENQNPNFFFNSKSQDALNVLRMQCQLCKAMHYIHILRKEAILYKKSSEAQIIVLKKVITNTTDSKSKMELDVMNQIMETDMSKAQLVSDYTSLVEETTSQCSDWKDSTTTSFYHTIHTIPEVSEEEEEEHSEMEDEDSEDEEDDDNGEYNLLNAEERRKIFEKRKNELMGAHLGLSQQIMVE